MKKLFIIISVFLAGFALVSCKGFLEENPTTSLSESTVYSTKEALEAHIYGCLKAFDGDRLWRGEMMEFFQPGSALIGWKGARTDQDRLDNLSFSKYSNTTRNYQMWQELYTGVNRCNRLIDNIPGSPVNEEYKTQIEAEAKFYRALFYFTIVRIWGDAPLLTSSPGSYTEAHSPRTAWYKIYIQVIKDLEFAEQNMRDKATQESINPEKNRPYKEAATAFKSSVYLTIGSLLTFPDDNFWDSSKDAALIAKGKDPRTPNFTDIGITSAKDAFTLARTAAESVINSGTYTLVPDFRQLFRFTDHQDFFLSESIFVLASSVGVNSGFLAQRSLPDKPEGTSHTTQKNSNWGRFRPSRWAIQNILKYSGGTKGTTGNEQYIYVTTSDPRWNASYYHDFKRSVSPFTQILTYPHEAGINQKDQTYYLPYFRKYADPTYCANCGNHNFYFMRLAEVYLNSAEASAFLSNGPGDADWNKALQRVNDLRKRARDSHDAGVAAPECPADWTTTTFNTKDDLILGIFWERAIELLGENHEWFDTHRYGANWLSKNIAKPFNSFFFTDQYATVCNSTYRIYTWPQQESAGYIYPEDPSVVRKGLLSAFPEQEYLLNNSITEEDLNDFYVK